MNADILNDLAARVEALEWKPISTYVEGDYVLFLLPEGERGAPVVEAAMAFWSDGELHAWTNGGPNSGSDYDFTSQPICWRKADAFTDYKALIAQHSLEPKA